MMQNGMSKFMGECHSVAPNAHHRPFMYRAPTGDRYHAF
jgi:hypothetical protein